MGARSARAEVLVAQLRAAGVRATRDPAEVLGAMPCVLVIPPRLTFDLPEAATVDWRLVALVAGPGGSVAFTQLDDLVDQVAGVFAVELADPVSYQLPGVESAPLPAYVITYRESV